MDSYIHWASLVEDLTKFADKMTKSFKYFCLCEHIVGGMGRLMGEVGGEGNKRSG